MKSTVCGVVLTLLILTWMRSNAGSGLQIDGSTLRTICMQHGPLLTFHLGLTQGSALIRYSTPQEAAKAQSALHMYVHVCLLHLHSPSHSTLRRALFHSIITSSVHTRCSAGPEKEM